MSWTELLPTTGCPQRCRSAAQWWLSPVSWWTTIVSRSTMDSSGQSNRSAATGELIETPHWRPGRLPDPPPV